MPNTFTHMNQPHASSQRYCILRGVILQVALEQVTGGDNYDRNPKILFTDTASKQKVEKSPFLKRKSSGHFRAPSAGVLACVQTPWNHRLLKEQAWRNSQPPHSCGILRSRALNIALTLQHLTPAVPEDPLTITLGSGSSLEPAAGRELCPIRNQQGLCLAVPVGKSWQRGGGDTAPSGTGDMDREGQRGICDKSTGSGFPVPEGRVR